ncbi:hypothetical protein AMST5_03602 [freshwater sediment metagenome]|uniref:Uncharacterized protein n=1 Tax=freshwater sediment metagenome TaxID=556182 RepID=A0AA48M296_9ZZZZ
MVKTIKSSTRNRRSPPRDPSRTSKQAAPTPVDPVAILEQIAGDKSLKPTPRVAACRELVRIRMALGAVQPPKTAEEKKTERCDRLGEEINARALRLMQPSGKA